MFFIARKENNNKKDSNNNKREREGKTATIAKEQGTIRTTTREV